MTQSSVIDSIVDSKSLCKVESRVGRGGAQGVGEPWDGNKQRILAGPRRRLDEAQQWTARLARAGTSWGLVVKDPGEPADHVHLRG